jgi:hypothetical protein
MKLGTATSYCCHHLNSLITEKVNTYLGSIETPLKKNTLILTLNKAQYLRLKSRSHLDR